MWMLIASLAVGLALGRLSRRWDNPRTDRFIGWAQTACLVFLLFMMGLKTGLLDGVFTALPTLGLRALVLTLGAVAGSILLAWGLQTLMRRRAR